MVNDPELTWQTLSDPAGALIGFAALIALLAASYWVKVARSIDDGKPSGPDVRSLGTAAVLTAAVMFLGGLGYIVSLF